MNWGALVISAAISASPAGEAPQGDVRQQVRVLVLDFGVLGIEDDIGKNLQMMVRNSIATIDGMQPISPVEFQIALAEPKAAVAKRCEGGTRCARLRGQVVGANKVIFGSISGFAGTYSYDLRAVDVDTGKFVGRDQGTLSGDINVIIPSIRLATYKLIAPHLVRGSLFVDIETRGIEIEVDGTSMGKTPMERPIDGLKPGAHVVVLKRPGFEPFQQEVVVEPFEATRVTLKAPKAPQSGGTP